MQRPYGRKIVVGFRPMLRNANALHVALAKQTNLHLLQHLR